MSSSQSNIIINKEIAFQLFSKLCKNTQLIKETLLELHKEIGMSKYGLHCRLKIREVIPQLEKILVQNLSTEADVESKHDSLRVSDLETISREYALMLEQEKADRDMVPDDTVSMSTFRSDNRLNIRPMQQWAENRFASTQRTLSSRSAVRWQ